MSASNVFDYVVNLTEKRFGKGYLTELDYLYGYAQLILMDEGILNSIFKDDADQKEIQEIKVVFERSGIDPKLLKNGAPLIHDSIDKADRGKTDTSFLESGKTAPGILEDLISGKIPNLDVMRNGNDINIVIDRATQLAKERKQKSEQQKPSEEKAGKSAPSSKDNSDDQKKESEEKKVQDNTDSQAEKTVEKKKLDYIELSRKTSRLYESLKRKIFGQDEAIKLFTEGYFQSEIFSSKNSIQKGPSASFLFAGPPGVGKTYLASSVAEILGMKFLRLDMSEYSMSTSVHTLSGVPKTYESPKPGKLTGFVKENPFSIVLVDEIEKADIDVIHQFLQVLDGGTLTDGFTEKPVSFNNVIMIFTTNVGKKLYENPSNTKLSTLPRSVIMKEIENEVDERGFPRFPPAICSRFASGNVVMFNRLEVHNFIDIINTKFAENAGYVNEIYGYDMEIDKIVAPMLLFSQSSRMDARNMSSQSTILIKNELYELGRHALDREEDFNSIEKIHLTVDLEKEDESIRKLFVNDDTAIILFIGNPDDLLSVPTSNKFRFEVSDKDKVLDDIAEKDISFVLIDMLYDSSDNDCGYLSLDDIKSESVVAFDLISRKFPNMPVYMTDERELRPEDVNIFLERGVREFIQWKDDGEFADKLSQISDMVYMQARVDELSGRGRVLTYNTAQKLNGNEADISFYDFKVQIAADADESKMLLSDNEKPTDRFEDVIGAENAKKELQYFVDYLKNPKKFMAKSVKLPNGILLYGPPGTGKTMLARAMAGESDVSFFSTTGTSFLNKYVGESEENVRRLFATAKKFAPSIIFIDEIDAIGKPRTGEPQNEASEKVLNTLLTEMQGFNVDHNRPVFVIAATNYSINGSSGVGNGLDEALMRRFDNKIEVDLPKTNEREKYINILLSKVEGNKVTSDTIHNIASRTTGESLGILKNIIDLAVRNSIRNKADLDDKLLLEALEEYMFGEKKEWDDKYYDSVAIHESGHAYVYWLSGKKPSFMTIVSRGNFGGYMQHEDPENTPSYTKDELLWLIRVSLAGRVAEETFFGKEGITTGIASDIQKATKTAFSILYSYAMSDSGLAAIPYDRLLDSSLGGEALQKVNEILEREMTETRKIVDEGKDKIRRLADYLRENNQATEKEILDIFEGNN